MLAHTLKGTAALLGAMALSDAASQLERHCKDAAAVAQRQTALHALQSAAAEALPQMQALLQTWALQAPAVAADVAAVPDAASRLERQALRSAMQELSQLLDANDLTALEKFATLRGALAGLPLALLDPLEGAMQDLDLEAASGLCRAIESWLEVPGTVDQAG
jgi:chemotaxis protein histidine kinase CheA